MFCLVLTGTLSLQTHAQNAPEAANSLKEVQVVNTSPLPGLGQPKDEIPTNVQSANAKDIEQSQAINLADFLN